MSKSSLGPYKNFSKPYTRFCPKKRKKKKKGNKSCFILWLVDADCLKYYVIGYLKMHDLSYSQDQAGHETLHICDIMFDGVYLWPASLRDQTEVKYSNLGFFYF